MIKIYIFFRDKNLLTPLHVAASVGKFYFGNVYVYVTGGMDPSGGMD